MKNYNDEYDSFLKEKFKRKKSRDNKKDDNQKYNVKRSKKVNYKFDDLYEEDY